MTNEYNKIDKTQSMRDIVYDILEINGNPMYYKDIWIIMRDYVGYVSHGVVPENSLYVVIGRDDRFSTCQGIVELTNLQQMSDENKCSVCTRQIQGNFKYCPYCRSELGPRCDKCGTELNNGWLCCPYCGPD
jgi:hypothetical protein